MEIFCRYVLYFILYAFLGWLMEVICKLVEQKKWINRGFLMGPICPIYGYGVLGIVFLIGRNKADLLSVFLKSIFVCSFLEYFTSYFMEKLFKARWWDYSQRKYNINGRICLETMLPFGILGCFVVYILHPLITKLVTMLTPVCQIVLALFFLFLYLIDNIISFHVMNKIKGEIKKERTDNTEKVRKKVIKWLTDNSFIYQHIKNAYPKFQVYKKKENKISKRKNTFF